MKCRHCSTELEYSLIDLGYAPPSNAYLSQSQLSEPEIYYPLRVKVCHICFLVQTEDYAAAESLFSEDYAYFSSTSRSWLKHAEQYCDEISEELGLNQSSLVLELACNDGYLLKNFLAKEVPCYGVEPTKSTALAAIDLGIPVVQEFFGTPLALQLAAQGKMADLVLGNNVYAHVPDINDFTLGIQTILKPSGTVTLEFPHLANLIELNQFDTIYHEHFSYLSLRVVSSTFERSGLRIWKVVKLPTHGGSLRVYGCHLNDLRETSPSVADVLREEAELSLDSLEGYSGFQKKALKIKLDLMDFLIEQKRVGKTVAAYGAAAKGNTLLNFCGIHSDLIEYVCDAAASKQGRLLPGSHIPIVDPSVIYTNKPEYILILPWNLRDEVTTLLHSARDWGAKFVIAVPELEIF
jgi:SAM-dependent methyltransferase